MAWYFQWSDALKKRACRYLLQRYLGQYLQEKLTLNQLSVDLYNGTGTITDVNLDVEALNEMADTYNLPIEFVDGYIRSISVCIPWSTLLKDSSFVEVQGLMATIQPKQRSGSVSVMNSMWGSMTTSMQLAEECLRQDQADAADNADRDAELSKPFEGLERFAQTIESVLCRIKVRFVDTTFRLEHVPKGSPIGVALELRIKIVDFFDEAGTENSSSSNDVNHLRNVHEPAAFSCKNFHLEGVTLHTDEFPSKARTFSKSVISVDSSPELKNLEMYTTAPETPTLDPLIQHSMFEPYFSCADPSASHHSAALNNLATQSDPILVAKLSGRHEIRLRVKLCDSMPGPRVSIDCSLGSVVVFCSPRQVHVLLELCSGIVSPDLEDDSNVCRSYAATNKPMQASDFKKVEQELQKHLTPRVQGRALHPQQGWSSQSLEDSDDEFHPIDGSGNRMAASISSNVSSQISDSDSMASSSTRFSPGGNPKGRRHASHHSPSMHMLVVDDALAESTYFKIQLSSLVIVVLHDNVLTPAASGHGLVTRSSVVQMKAQGEAFFAELGVFSLADRDLESAHRKLSTVCQVNHLRFIAAPFTFEGTEKASSSVRIFNCNLTVGTAEFTECLFDAKSLPSHPIRPEYSTLLGFVLKPKETTNRFQSSGYPTWSLVEPCIRVKISHCEHLPGNSVKLRRVATPPPRTEIHLDLAACHSELDITIIDRISGLLDQKDLCGRPPGEHHSTSSRQPPTNQGFLTQAMEEETASGDGRKLDLSISASKATLYVRFPVPDLRPLHDMERMPWWKRAIRSDVLTLEITDLRLRTAFVVGETNQTIDISCRELHGLFQENADDPPNSFLHASAGSSRSGEAGVGGSDGEDDGFDWPRLTVKIFPPAPALALEEQESEESDDPMHASSLDTLVHDLCSSDGAEPSPFSTRKIIYKSDQASNEEPDQAGGRRRQNDNTMDSEQMILPAERSEAIEFIERSAANCQFVIELSSANVNIVLPSKHFYEVLYNRISTDLLLWERAAPRPVAKDPSGFRPPPLNHDWANSYVHDAVYETFSMCKSARHDDTSSDSDEERPSYVTYGEHRRRQTRRRRRSGNGCSSAVYLQNRVCFTLTSKQAAVTLRSPLRESVDKVVSEHHGEMQFQVSDVLFFVVSTAPTSLVDNYMCVHVNQAAFYHHGFLPSSPVDYLCRVGPTSHSSRGHLLPTLYQSEPGTRTKHVPNTQNSESPDMLMVAIRVILDTVRRVKTFRVAVGVRDATLRHRVTLSSECWYQQLVDFFDVLDYPVMGYQTPEVITELHLHTWGCAVDYRPVNLPLRVVLAVETFSICSNIAAQTSTSVVRVLLEDVYLFLSKNLDAHSVDLKKNYVCVVDVGFFELSLRLSDAKDQRLPKMDVRASNNMLHIRTCVDSCRALQELIGYLATDGDLRDGQEFSAANSDLSLNEESDLSTLTNVEAEQVHNLMAEAMKESGSSSRASSECDNTASNSELSTTGDVFLFPDEARRPTNGTDHSVSTSIPRHSKVDDESHSSPSGDSLDEEFCILENDPGVGILSRSGEPQVRILTTEPLNIVENHFSVPLGRIDQLKAPKHFPTPTVRYTLHEISLIWHLYGGSDFSSSDSQVNGVDLPKGHEIKTGSSPNFRDARNMGVTFSKANHGDVQFRMSSKSSPTSGHSSFPSDASVWRTNGGPGRQHDVLVELQLNKVRFRHEKYPDNAEQASRQILLIHEVEIRDRLASSQMNKFLYLYSSESMPRQSHANMVVVKALHLRSDPSGASEECALKVSLLPLRLNVDQDALFFLYHFVGGLSSGGRNEVPVANAGSDGDLTSMAMTPSPSAPAPIPKVPMMSVAAAASSPPASTRPVNGAATAPIADASMMSESHDNLLIFDELPNAEHEVKVRFSGIGTTENYGDASSVTSSSTASTSSLLFFRSFVFSPDVPIRLDYHGKRVDMEQGALAGLVMGLGQLNCSELRLKRLSYRHGLLGADRLLTYALSEWLHDIRQTQLPGVLGGVGPFHSLVQLFQGCRDLFWLPIEQYRKDGRIIRGLQRGANAFTTSTAMAALELANRLVQAVQCTAEIAYDVVSPGPGVRATRAVIHGHAGTRRLKRPSQPADIREGMANALQVVKEGLGDTARTIVQVASEEHEHKGISGAVGGVLRQIPPTVVKPIILATEATSNVLGGMRHQLAPDVRREAAEKWRSDND